MQMLRLKLWLYMKQFLRAAQWQHNAQNQQQGNGLFNFKKDTNNENKKINDFNDIYKHSDVFNSIISRKWLAVKS